MCHVEIVAKQHRLARGPSTGWRVARSDERACASGRPRATIHHIMSKRTLNAVIRQVTPLYAGFLKLNRYEIEADRHDGGRQLLTWEVVQRGHAVAVLGYDPAPDCVVLINEMRPGALVAGEYPYTESLVAGGIAEGEDAISAAIREMREEAALELHAPFIMHPGTYASPG